MQKNRKDTGAGSSSSVTKDATRAHIRALLPARAADGNKGSFGRVYLLCGSTVYTGAALLSAEGALRMGAGYVTLMAPPSVIAPARVRLPELLCREMPALSEEPEAYLPLFGEDVGRGAILVGPGIGTVCEDGAPADPHRFAAVLADALAYEGVPVILDADALNLLARACGGAPMPHRAEGEASYESEGCVSAFLRRARRAVVITPHPMEFSRISGLSLDEIAADRVGSALRFAAESGAVVLLKGKGTVIASPDGAYAVNPTGSVALAKGGSGDVLGGMLAALIAGGAQPYAAAQVAAYLHGAAGDAAARELSDRGVLPSELPSYAARELCRLLAET